MNNIPISYAVTYEKSRYVGRYSLMFELNNEHIFFLFEHILKISFN